MKKYYYCVLNEDCIQFVHEDLNRAKFFVENEDDGEDYEVLEVISIHSMKRTKAKWTKK